MPEDRIFQSLRIQNKTVDLELYISSFVYIFDGALFRCLDSIQRAAS